MRQKSLMTSESIPTRYGDRMRAGSAIGLVALIGLALPHVSGRVSSLLLGYALAVLLAAWISPQQIMVAVSGIVASLLACYNLPPEHTFYIASPYRMDYALFLGTCGLISLYRPARNCLMPVPQRAESPQSRFETNKEAVSSVLLPPAVKHAALTDTLARPEIYFLHIPKTAGSSLNILLHDVYPDAQCMPHFDWQELLGLTSEEIGRYRCYSGHYGTSLYTLLGRDIPTITLLRDPFERSVSQILHSERAGQASGFHLLSAARCHMRKFYFLLWERTSHPRLLQCLESRYVTPLLYEHQTLSLGMEINFALLRTEGACAKYRERMHKLPPSQDMDTLLEQAKRRLDGMAIVGTAERFAQSLELLCDYLGVPIPPLLPETNVGPGHSIGFHYRASGVVSPALAARIDEITRYDRELYAYANHLLDAQWARYQSRK